MFSVFGFGASPNFMGIDEVSFCFPLNSNEKNPQIKGIEQVVERYEKTLAQITFQGPTNVGPLLQKFKNLLESTKEDKTY